MKVLFIQNGIHPKNLNAIQKYNIQITTINHTNLDNIDLSEFDVIYSPCSPVNVSKYPNIKFMFGPHFSVFPNTEQMNLIRENKNVIYVQPSDWARDVWKNNPICNGVRVETMPFGVDTDKFNEIKTINERNNVFIYFKRRNPDELMLIQDLLREFNISYRVFNYLKRYNENEYIDYLHNSKFGIWLDAHESQGFALEEALSCNVPLLVWDVTSMKQENGSNYSDIPATTIPYWDERCGESFINSNELQPTFDKFINKINTYKPRELILENLSIEKCSEKFINIVNKNLINNN
jgi:hypothetical protein